MVDSVPDVICPITLSPPQSPVQASDGNIYEHDAIKKWLLQKNTSPVTRDSLEYKLTRLKPTTSFQTNVQSSPSTISMSSEQAVV